MSQVMILPAALTYTYICTRKALSQAVLSTRFVPGDSLLSLGVLRTLHHPGGVRAARVSDAAQNASELVHQSAGTPSHTIRHYQFQV